MAAWKRRTAKIIHQSAPCRTRTCDPRIRNPLLYPAELRAQLKSQLGTLLCSGVPVRQGDLTRAEGRRPNEKQPHPQGLTIAERQWRQRQATVSILILVIKKTKKGEAPAPRWERDDLQRPIPQNVSGNRIFISL